MIVPLTLLVVNVEKVLIPVLEVTVKPVVNDVNLPNVELTVPSDDVKLVAT